MNTVYCYAIYRLYVHICRETQTGGVKVVTVISTCIVIPYTDDVIPLIYDVIY